MSNSLLTRHVFRFLNNCMKLDVQIICSVDNCHWHISYYSRDDVQAVVLFK